MSVDYGTQVIGSTKAQQELQQLQKQLEQATNYHNTIAGYLATLQDKSNWDGPDADNFVKGPASSYSSEAQKYIAEVNTFQGYVQKGLNNIQAILDAGSKT
ncbi:MAG TPA: hypothetical protein VKY90_16835 [Candidatus Dormibacteraeota bacterium]|nr:hypothetical protein [Candidatus Dormibacteraeota bacterium]